MTDNEKQARLDGQMAFLAGKPATDNPHPMNTSFSRAWARGWREIGGDVQAARPRKDAL